MKPRKPRKPLERRTPIKAKTQLAQNTPLKSRGPVKPRKRSTQTREEKDGRDAVKARSLVDELRKCEIAILPGCMGRATDFHHRQNRSQLGSWEPANALDLCRSCHMTITDTRAEYYDNGWCVRSHEDPLTKPVLRRGQWVVLDNEGGYVPSLDLGAA